MALPALGALRRARADARITLIGRWAPLLCGQGVADVLLPYPRRVGERLVFAGAMRRQRPELAVLLPNSFEAALASCGWGAARRLGFDTDARRPLLTDAVPLPSPRRHQADEYGLLLERENVSVGDATPVWHLPRRPSIDAEVDALLKEANVADAGTIVGLHLGASFGPSKQWPPASFGALATRLAEGGLRPLLLGSAADADAARAASAAAGAPLPSLVGRDRPDLLPWLITRLDCLVSGDTGVAHLAAALGVSTVTLFGPTDPRLTAPRAKSARVVDRWVACSPCFFASCPIDHVCLTGVAAADVCAEVMKAVRA